VSGQHWAAFARSDEAYPQGVGLPGGEIVALTEPGRFLGDILDADNIEAVVVSRSVDHGAVVALDASRASIVSACVEAVRRGQTVLRRDVAEVSGLFGYNACWEAVLGAPSWNQGMSWFVLEVDVAAAAADGDPTIADRIGGRRTLDRMWPATVRPLLPADVTESAIAVWLVTLGAAAPGVTR